MKLTIESYDLRSKIVTRDEQVNPIGEETCYQGIENYKMECWCQYLGELKDKGCRKIDVKRSLNQEKQ